MPVSYTHLDVYKRQGLKPIEIGESGQIKEWYDETALGQTANGKIYNAHKEDFKDTRENNFNLRLAISVASV